VIAMRSLILSLALYGLFATTHAYMQPFKPAGLFGGARLAKFSSPMLRTAPLALRRKGVNPAKMTAAATEKFEFQAEVSRVMDIIINSLYSEKDVFLRELVSNAADACDKKRFLSLTEGKGQEDTLEIRIKADKEAKTLTIEDVGVGMSKEELVNNLGKIAQSGTKQFAEAMKAKESGNNDVNLIGQFGVGFYSGFLVADKITVITKGFNDASGKTYKWESEAGSSFTITELENSDEIKGASGSKLILSLREDAEEYLDDFKIKSLVSRYSEFVNFPIRIWSSKTTYEQVPDEEANKDLKEGEEPKKKTVPIITQDWELQNTQKPLWMRPPSKVTPEQYEEFYKSTFKAWDKPVTVSHFSLEGQVEFRAMLFVPSQLPFELGANMFDENSKNMRLYVKRVFINDNFQELCPRWLKFVKGIVDSEDLPLNVGREILQKSAVLRVVRRRIEKKCIDMFADLKSKGGDDWQTFQKNFGKYLKVGVVEDNDNRQDIGALIQFPTSAFPKNASTLDGYVSRMKAGQECIYFIPGEGRAQCEMSPAMDKVKDSGYEVLFCTEPLDELCVMELKNFQGKDLVDLTKDEVKGIDDVADQKTKKEEAKQVLEKVLSFLQAALGSELVSKVEVSLSLRDSPAGLAQGQYGMSPQMQKYMKARAVSMGDSNDPDFLPPGMPSILQVNPEHPIVQSLKAQVEAGQDGEEQKRTARLLYNVAALRSGYEIQNPREFATLVTELMTSSA